MQFRHAARRFIGQNVHRHPRKLSAIDGRQQTFIIGRQQNMVACFVQGQSAQVLTHDLQQGHTTIQVMRKNLANNLTIDVQRERLFGVPIYSLNSDFQA